MNKTDVVNQIAQKTGFPVDICEKAVKAFEDASGDALIGKLTGNTNNRADLLNGIAEKAGIGLEEGAKLLDALEAVLGSGLSDKLKFIK